MMTEYLFLGELLLSVKASFIILFKSPFYFLEEMIDILKRFLFLSCSY